MNRLTSRLALVIVAVAAVATFARADDTPTPAVSPRAADVFNKTVPRRITVRELQKRIDDGTPMVILDTRVEAPGPVAKGALHVRNDQLETWAKGHDRKQLIVAYCT